MSSLPPARLLTFEPDASGIPSYSHNIHHDRFIPVRNSHITRPDYRDARLSRQSFDSDEEEVAPRKTPLTTRHAGTRKLPEQDDSSRKRQNIFSSALAAALWEDPPTGLPENDADDKESLLVFSKSINRLSHNSARNASRLQYSTPLASVRTPWQNSPVDERYNTSPVAASIQQQLSEIRTIPGATAALGPSPRYTRKPMNALDAMGLSSKYTANSLAWTPLGAPRQLLATFLSGPQGECHTWDPATLDIRTFRPGCDWFSRENARAVTAIDWDCEGRRIVTGSVNGAITLFDAETGHCICHCTDGPPAAGTDGSTLALEWQTHPSLITSSSADGSLYLNDVRLNGRSSPAMSGTSIGPLTSSSSISDPDADSGEATSTSTFYSRRCPITCLKWYDENLLTTGDRAGCIALWDVRRMSCSLTDTSAGNKCNPIWKVKTPLRRIASLDWSSAGAHTSHRSSGVSVWSSKPRESPAVAPYKRVLAFAGRQDALGFLKFDSLALTQSPIIETIYTGNTHINRVLWTKNPSVLITLHSPLPRARQPSPPLLLHERLNAIEDGSAPPPTSPDYVAHLENTIKFWSFPSLTQIASFPKAHPRLALHATLSSDGERLVTGGQDKTIRVWQVPDFDKLDAAKTGKRRGEIRISKSGMGLGTGLYAIR